jgi:predicted RNase H-like HicB family nuclease
MEMGGKTIMKYTIIIEKAGRNYSAYSPDVPGCIAAGRTVEQARRMIREALEFHLQGLIADGLPLPKAKAHVEQIEVPYAA